MKDKNMGFKGIFAGRSFIVQTFILLLLILLGALVSNGIGLGIYYAFYGINEPLANHPGMMKIIQLISAVGTFLFPALAAAYIFSRSVRSYLSIRQIHDTGIFLLIIPCMFFLSPVITLTGLLNKKLVLPDFLLPLEQWMQQMESQAELMTELMLSGEGILALLGNLVVVALAAGITEEFLFRGAIQRIFGRHFSNPHVIIWSVALFFSAFHMQFYGFLPRMILGAFFGYLLYWSKSIWLPVFAHFLNNAFAVIVLSMDGLKDNDIIQGDIPPDWITLYVLWATVSTGLLYICVGLLRKRLDRSEHPLP